jgi:hypothetical protein
MRTGLIIAAGVLTLFVASLFVPFSLHGPAISCFDAANKKVASAKVLEFAASHNFALNEVSAYLANSDFVIRNVHTSENTLTIVFEKNRTGGSCLFFDAISIDGNLVIIELAKHGQYNYDRIQSVLQSLMSEFSGNTYIEFADGTEIALSGVTIAQLTAGDFLFV